MHTAYSRYIGLCPSIHNNGKFPINNPRVKRDLEIQDYRLEPENKLILYHYMLNTFSRRNDSAVEQYQDPEKRRGGRKQSAEVAAHKVAWAAGKKK